MASANEKTKWVTRDIRMREDVLQRFSDRLPIYGALTWAVQMSLEAIVDEIDRDPELQDRLREAIQRKITSISEAVK